MSRNDEKPVRITDPDFSALDAELAALAQETPDVPADFHDQWVQAVRKDAENNPREGIPAGGNKAAGHKADIRRQRRHILSAAAAFVLVIGGVWLLRDRTNVLDRRNTAPAAREQAASAPVQGGGGPEDPAPEAVPTEDTELAMSAAVPLEDEALGLTAAMEEPEAPAQDVNVGAAAGNWYGEAEAAYEADEAAEYIAFAADTGGPAAESEAAESEAAENRNSPEKIAAKQAEAAQAPMTTAMPEMTAVPEPTAVPEAAEAPAAAGEAPAGEPADDAAAPGEGEEISFLQRVWNFVLEATPWILGAVVIVLFLVTYAIRARQRKKKAGNG